MRKMALFQRGQLKGSIMIGPSNTTSGGAFAHRNPRRRGCALALTAGVLALGAAQLGLADKPAGALKTQHDQYFDHRPSLQKTGRFVVMHNTEARTARTAAELLSLTRHTFYATFQNNGFTLKPLDSPMVCLVFDQKQEFVEYGKQADNRDMSWSGGYYSSRTNRVALYKSPAYGIPNVVPDKEEALATDGKSASTANAKAPDNKHNETSSADNPLLGSDTAEVATLARTTHEAAHQMAFNSGLQKRGVMYPFWVSEGLATMFELNQQRALGPAAANPRRRETLLQAHQAGALPPLNEFVAQTRIDTSDAQAVRRSYAHAWGLFRFLLEHQPDAMRDYLQKLKAAPYGKRTPRALRHDFVEAFGAMAEVKEAWQRWLTRLK